MENINNIISELRKLAPTLSQVPHRNPFLVPPNHAAELAEGIMLAARDAAHDDELETPLLDQLRDSNPFLAPDGHFAGLHNQLMDRLQEAGMFPKTPEEAGYTVPEGYFGSLPAEIMDKVDDHASMGEQTLQLLESDAGFAVPQGYFGQLHISIAERIAEMGSPALENLKEKQGFDIPQGYFAGLHSSIMQKVGEEQTLENDLAASGEYENEPETPFADGISQERQPMQVPQGYFAKLHNTIMDKMQDADLETPQLDELAHESGFKIPAGYFGQLKTDITRQAGEAGSPANQGARVIPMHPLHGRQNGVRHLVRRLAVAASVLLVFFAGWQVSQKFGLNPKGGPQTAGIIPIDELVATLNKDEVAAYVNEYFFDFSDEMEDETFLGSIDTDRLPQPSLGLGLSQEEKNRLLEELNVDDILMDLDADDLNLDLDVQELLEQHGI